ncbi:MAG TPA: hypothetical protein VMW42_00715 [Desulfatiglandales bacterium]|nr:hypothetical protein [Desulfatiglandales bacterium]
MRQKKKIILDKKEIKQGLKRIAQQIVSKHGSLKDIVLVGIRTGGAFLAYRLRDEILMKDKSKDRWLIF